jgi:bacillithiol system protein YtxJ
MHWNIIDHPAQLPIIVQQSSQRPQVIFKHSTRCPISSMAKNRLERSQGSADIDFHYLDLIAYRPISNKVAEDFNVWHESPQVLVIKNGACVYDESHSAISMDDIKAAALTVR